ncbi:MAG: hypothetical protein U0T85_02790 [Cloacibacterium normanense]
MKTKNISTILFILFASFLFSQTIDVMSFNIRLASVDDGENHWNIRKDKVKDLISYYEADFVDYKKCSFALGLIIIWTTYSF